MCGCQPPKRSTPFLQAARETAVERQRRVIFNNDGDDLWHIPVPATKEGFLSVRTDHVADTMVDSLFYFSRRPISPLYTGTVESEPVASRLKELSQQGADDLKLVIDACRKQGIEVFWSMRMNDIHDNAKDEAEIAQWKKDHRRLLMGRPEDKKRYPPTDPRHIWTFVDYAHPEVRDLMVETFRAVLDGYDVDGVDLDFLRHPAFFQETRLLQPATQPHLEMMTDLVGRIRKEVLAASNRKSKAILMSVRILPTLDQNRHFGFDIQRWVEQGYVDLIVVGGGYDPFTMPAKDMIDRGHDWGVPVYVCLSSSGFVHAIAGGRFFSTDASQWSRSQPDASDRVALQGWRAAAANAWHAGADGIMTFNLFPKHAGSRATEMARRVWSEIGDPEGLACKDKLYVVENLESMNAGFMVGSVPVEGRLPIEVKPGSTVQRVLPVADDLAGARDRVEFLKLRMKLTGLRAGDAVTVHINEEKLSLDRTDPDWMAGEVPARVMRQGQNFLTVRLAAAASPSLMLSAIEMEVKYQR